MTVSIESPPILNSSSAVPSYSFTFGTSTISEAISGDSSPLFKASPWISSTFGDGFGLPALSVESALPLSRILCVENISGVDPKKVLLRQNHHFRPSFYIKNQPSSDKTEELSISLFCASLIESFFSDSGVTKIKY